MACRAISSEAFGEEEIKMGTCFWQQGTRTAIAIVLANPTNLPRLASAIFIYEILLPNTFTVPHITPLKSGLCMKAVYIVIQAMFVCRLY